MLASIGAPAAQVEEDDAVVHGRDDERGDGSDEDRNVLKFRTLDVEFDVKIQSLSVFDIDKQNVCA